MSERDDLHGGHGGEDEKRAASAYTYEPPTVVDLGSFEELTRQRLKISGSADAVNFQPSHV